MSAALLRRIFGREEVKDSVSETIHPVLGAVTLAQRRCNRRISLSVRPDGRILLSYPLGVSRKRALEFLESKVEWVMLAQRKLAERREDRRKFTDEEIAAMRKQAKEVLPPMVERLAARFGFRYGRVTIRATRSKWGSCSPDNNISLSLFLMALPEHLQEYVIIHELCHTVHHNHSARFHALADRCMGGREKELRRELRGYGFA